METPPQAYVAGAQFIDDVGARLEGHEVNLLICGQLFILADRYERVAMRELIHLIRGRRPRL